MKQEILQQALAQRNEEILHYQINIDNYTLMIQSLPAEWPAEIAHLRGSDVATVIANIQDEQLAMLASDLIFKDKLAATLMTEKIEQRKAIMVRDVIQQQLAG